MEEKNQLQNSLEDWAQETIGDVLKKDGAKQ